MATQQEKQERAYAAGLAQGRQMVEDFKAYAPWGLRYAQDAARCLAKLIGWPTDELVSQVAAYHQERLAAVPDSTKYPELRGYPEILAAEERGLQESGLDFESVALLKTLNFWRDTRLLQQTGRAWFTLPTPEKCRVVYVPESDKGPLHAKNVDDPMHYWRPEPPKPDGTPWPWGEHPLVFDGVGSGLHIDEMPPEIFPADALQLCREHCTTVPEAREFLVKYNFFWGGQNLLVHDYHGNSAALEKTRCRVAVRGPNAQGINYINGMGAVDPDISAFQKAQRQKYLDQQGWTRDESIDGRFFQVCEGKFANMARYVDELSLNPTFDNLKQLMEQRDPSGPMCLMGKPAHPADPSPGYTLIMNIFWIDAKKQHRRQWRGNVPVYLDTPEIIQYN